MSLPALGVSAGFPPWLDRRAGSPDPAAWPSSVPHGQPHADAGGGDAAGVVHGLQFVVAHDGLPGEGFGGGAGAEVAAVGEPVDLAGAGRGVGFEQQAVLFGGVGLDVVGEGGLGAEDPGRRADRGGPMRIGAPSPRRPGGRRGGSPLCETARGDRRTRPPPRAVASFWCTLQEVIGETPPMNQPSRQCGQCLPARSPETAHTGTCTTSCGRDSSAEGAGSRRRLTVCQSSGAAVSLAKRPGMPRPLKWPTQTQSTQSPMTPQAQASRKPLEVPVLQASPIGAPGSSQRRAFRVSQQASGESWPCRGWASSA